jgi:hypothetical protein
MSRGKHLSLEEARKQDQLKQFCKEHPSEGNEEVFDRLLDAMAEGKPTSEDRTSTQAASED